MLRVLFFLCMAWIVVLNSMVYSVICVQFQLNRSFIAEVFCEDRDIPMSTCQGSCYLSQQLADAPSDQETGWMQFRADFHLFTFPDSLILPFPTGTFSLVNVPWQTMAAYEAILLVLDKPPIPSFFLLS